MLWIWSYPVRKKELFLKLAVPKKLAKSLKAIYKELRFYCICDLQSLIVIKKIFHSYFPRVKLIITHIITHLPLCFQVLGAPFF